MLEAAALRESLAAFLGAERFRKFLQQLRNAGRLRFWHEQQWERSVAAHPEFVVSEDERAIALRVCWLHGVELLPDTVEAIDCNIDYTKWYLHARLAGFPCAESGPMCTEGAPFPTRPPAVWYCQECRKAEAVWQASQAEPIVTPDAAGT